MKNQAPIHEDVPIHLQVSNHLFEVYLSAVATVVASVGMVVLYASTKTSKDTTLQSIGNYGSLIAGVLALLGGVILFIQWLRLYNPQPQKRQIPLLLTSINLILCFAIIFIGRMIFGDNTPSQAESNAPTWLTSIYIIVSVIALVGAGAYILKQSGSKYNRDIRETMLEKIIASCYRQYGTASNYERDCNCEGFNVSICNLGLSTRAFNCLIQEDIKKTSDLAGMDCNSLLNIRLLGTACLNEIIEKMRDVGFKKWANERQDELQKSNRKLVVLQKSLNNNEDDRPRGHS